jgi:hypothetical protein
MPCCTTINKTNNHHEKAIIDFMLIHAAFFGDMSLNASILQVHAATGC